MKNIIPRVTGGIKTVPSAPPDRPPQEPLAEVIATIVRLCRDRARRGSPADAEYRAYLESLPTAQLRKLQALWYAYRCGLLAEWAGLEDDDARSPYGGLRGEALRALLQYRLDEGLPRGLVVAEREGVDLDADWALLAVSAGHASHGGGS